LLALYLNIIYPLFAFVCYFRHSTEAKHGLQMKLFFKYLRQYVQEHFNLKLYLSIAGFLIVCIMFNYYFDFEDSVIDSYFGQPIQLLYFFLFQSIPFYTVCFLIYHFTSVKEFVYQRGFWVTSLVGFIVLALDRSFHLHQFLLPLLPYQLDTYVYRCISNLSTFLVVVTPLYLFYKLIDKRQSSFYGVTSKGVTIKPYLILLLLVLPLVVGASFSDDFLRQYPMYQRANGLVASQFLKLPEWVMAMGYEITYALSFFSVELFFRGFLILGLMRYLGPYVILPMVATYAFLHFGKPVGETIGSIFGGYILGIVAYYSRNIWGGVVVHMGLALLMEFAAFLHR